MALNYDIKFNNRTPLENKICSKFIIRNILPIAGEYDGKAFGGFVRDIIVPHFILKERLKDCRSFKDLDLWFPTRENYLNFLREIEKNSRFELCNYNIAQEGEKKESLYQFEKRCFLLKSCHNPICFVDMIVAPVLPVDDFNVNTITAIFFRNGTFTLGSHRYDAFALIDDIRNKTVRMEKSYFDKINRMINQSPYKHQMILYRIYSRYIDRGWKVTIGGIQFDPQDGIEHLSAGPVDSWLKFIGKNKNLKFDIFFPECCYRINSGIFAKC